MLFDLCWPVRDFILSVKLVGRMGPFRLLSVSYSKAVWLCPCDEVNSPGIRELNLLSGWNRCHGSVLMNSAGAVITECLATTLGDCGQVTKGVVTCQLAPWFPLRVTCL